MEPKTNDGPSCGAGSFADFYRSSAYARFPQQHRSHPQSGFRAFVVDQTAHDFTDIACSDWVLGLPLKAACPTRFDYGEGWRRQPRGKGDFLLVPPGTEVRYEIAGPTRLLVLTWPGGAMSEIDEGLFRDEQAALRPLIGRYFRNNVVEATCRAIWLEMARSDEASRLLLESGLAQLAGGLFRCAAARAEKAAHRRIEVRRALSFIEDNFQRDLSLKDLAAVAGLSLFHFVREFHLQVGETPYRYIQKRRVERALLLMRQHDLTREEAARLAGFSSARAMRIMVRRHAAEGG